ncbi:MAG: DUF1134 domain-containing protein [Hyphomicrobiaceae bacterium]
MLRCLSRVASLIICGVAVVMAPAPATAQACIPKQIYGVVDQTGSRLREIHNEAQPRIRERLQQLAAKRGWKESEIDLKSREFLDDDRTRAFDKQAGQLLDKLSRLGDDSQSGKIPTCDRLAQARTTAAQLIEVTMARTAHVSSRLTSALQPPAATSQQARPAPAPKIARPSKPPPAAPRPPDATSWDTATVKEVKPRPEVMAALPRPIDPGDLGFTPQEILAAGRGLFGSISAGLASVIDYAFATYGRPTGYILGTEGGAAFLAGLRYGHGQLVTKSDGGRTVYWQGPSVGYDVGLAGSRVMFLVYNLKEHDQIYARFLGVDGSAYLVGGVGMTFLKRGQLVLAPIRTGLGLRFGANVGYLKFTPNLSFNPF